MSYASKMLKLDFFTMKSKYGTFASVALIIAMFCFMGSSLIVLGVTAAWSVSLLMMDIFIIQEKNNLERLYAALSIDLRNIVLGRYAFIYINYGIALLFTIVAGIVALYFRDIPVNVQEIITAVCVSLLMFTMIMGIQMPIYFRYGYTKAKIRCLIPFILVMSVVVLSAFSTVFVEILGVLAQHQMTISAVSVVIAGIVFCGSYKVAVSCYQMRK